MSFTPGPWSVEVNPISEEDGRYFGSIYAADGGPVVYVSEGTRDNKTELTANANLIAAAPELFESLRAILTNPSSAIPVDLLEPALAAITKANGGKP